MKCKQNLINAAAGFLAGIIFLSALLFGFSGAPRYQPFDAAVERVSSSEIRQANAEAAHSLQDRSADSDLLVRLFQILFWLFLISPPVIVVLLLVIISKMDRKKSLE